MRSDQSLLLLHLVDLLHGAGDNLEEVAAPFQEIAEASCLVDAITQRRLKEGERLFRQTQRATDVHHHTALILDACALQRVLRMYAGQLAGTSASDEAAWLARARPYPELEDVPGTDPC